MVTPPPQGCRSTMAPPLKPPHTVEDSKAAGLQTSTDFFRRNKVRISKKSHQLPQGKAKTKIRKKKRGPVPGENNPPLPTRTATSTKTAARKPPPKESPSKILAKNTRTNWGKGEPLE